MASSALHTEEIDSSIIALARTLLCQVSQQQTRVTPAQPWSITIEQLQTLDAIVCKIYTVVRGLINLSASRINGLPDEILCHIFRHVPGLAHERLIRPTYSACRAIHARDIFPLTAVCQQWRRIILGTSSFWSTVGIGLVGHFDCQHPHFDRYSGGPIYTYVHIPKQPMVAKSLFERAAHILNKHSAEVREFYGSWNVEPLLSFPLPNIEHCTLEYVSPEPLPGTSQFSLFGGHTPRVRTLMFHNVSVLPLGPFVALTHLCIFVTNTSTYRSLSSVGDLLGLLSGSPQLRELLLESYSPWDASRFSNDMSGVVVPLDSLQRFRICSDFNSYAHPRSSATSEKALPEVLLPHLRFPETCITYFDNLRVLDFERCAMHMDSSRGASHLSLNAQRRPSHCRAWEMRGYGFVESICAVDVERAVYSRFDLCADRPQETESTAQLQDALHLPMFRDIRELCLNAKSEDVWRPPFLAAILPNLPSLEVLVANFDIFWARGCLRAMDHFEMLRPELSGDGSWKVICPALTTLQVEFYTIDPGLENHADLEDLQDLARARSQAGHPLCKLLIGDWEWESGVGYGGRYILQEYDGEGEFVKTYDPVESAHLCPEGRIRALVPADWSQWVKEKKPEWEELEW